MAPSSLQVAAQTIRHVNPRIRVTPAPHKLCPDTEPLFSEPFWAQVDVVATALDNVDARRYVDAQVPSPAYLGPIYPIQPPIQPPTQPPI